MGFLMGCGICCMSISVWGVIQLVFMGIFYYIESFTLIEDAEEHHYEDTIDFIKKTTNNYNQLAINCWLAACLYLLTMGLCAMCIMKARSKAKKQATILESDILSCAPEDAKKKEEKGKEHAKEDSPKKKELSKPK